MCVFVYKKYYRMCGLNNRNSFSHSSRGGKSTIWLGSDESSFLDLQVAASLLCVHMAFPGCLGREGEIFSSSYEATNPAGLEPHPYILI